MESVDEIVEKLSGYIKDISRRSYFRKRQDVYGQIVTISTIAAVVMAAIALLMMNFSRSGRTVDESRAWLKRIVVTWAINNGLGFIMIYSPEFFCIRCWREPEMPDIVRCWTPLCR